MEEYLTITHSIWIDRYSYCIPMKLIIHHLKEAIPLYSDGAQLWYDKNISTPARVYHNGITIKKREDRQEIEIEIRLYKYPEDSKGLALLEEHIKKQYDLAIEKLDNLKELKQNIINLFPKLDFSIYGIEEVR